MADPNVANARSPNLETFYNRPRDLRRARPPDITILKNETRVPLRPERLSKRESKIGIRSIFGKSKTVKDKKAAEEPSSQRESSRHGGIRNSLAEIGNWPQRLQHSRSELSLSSPASSRSTVPDTPSSMSQTRQGSIGVSKSKSHQPASSKSRGSVTTFDPPPLFQMYPQAIKHATLPTCLTSIDALVRLGGSKSNLTQNDPSRSDLALDQDESEKKKKSKSAPEWTDKIYSLITSGYLLQYAAEGSFDRLPEKVLHLTRDSAAYATDLIPGRHWVVRVASSTDADGNPSSDTKSFRTKLALRGTEKRQVSNMLLVFESPEIMDTWLAILRREIESLGGKKKLSETGKAEGDDETAMLRAQASQRTLVVRDPDRFSRILSQDFSWTPGSVPVDSNESETPNPRMSESTLDDVSTTVSMISSDGLRLENLRDSGGGISGNRFSFISSGQPTIVSSAGSSPVNSPIRESFSSYDDDCQGPPAMTSPVPMQEARPRPNAAAIVNRRQSMQMMIPHFDPDVDLSIHPDPASPNVLSSALDGRHQSVPNFSIPQTVNRRYSTMNLPSSSSGVSQQQVPDRDGSTRPLRRSSPMALSVSRPLSIVLDQPSPRAPYSSTLSTSRVLSQKVSGGLPSRSASQPHATSKLRPQERSEASKRNFSLFPRQPGNLAQRSGGATTNTGHRAKGNSHSSVEIPAHPRAGTGQPHAVRPVQAEIRSRMSAPEPIRRAASSLEMRRGWTTPTARQLAYKRTTIIAESSSSRNRHSFIYAKQYNLPSIEETGLAPPPLFPPNRSAPSLRTPQETPSTPEQPLAVDASPKSLLSRRSLPQLAEGPPPAPPPTCALPPIPGKRSSTPAPSSIKV
ncbi:hypothetical protein GGS23DRAFT_408105 [Durotheca rogersii]|uniref:uncharacterized protein n=1 Tax=Durotheca rogersii TaxID=419775 RepID=UPI002220A5EB|nr:uncharacterized protein GGS23DRAFT_408105 [Durotheca rogersii]KAI5865087.1 hypothetical protein GGS23DRAFT_408105 [Durotheca rogersii]